ncbi:MAG: FKBP-type peptidyl-prolyl cis-trans isomerase [Gammaproteobacteria bacterium SHHR-1]|uniref:FKBP-type peptidyl-prolyl cis-trans isomerase n=1 Tax=Magnetovirga frankeli TaxID=947516 RepID=UPI001AF5C821|nr:FKBP-type peptidyl-prolyl cis-trans isomerase [gamma proteobacterium SS-5]
MPPRSQPGHQPRPGPLIGPGSRVRAHLALYLVDGEELLSTFAEEPLVFQIGDGSLSQGLQLAFYGLRAGAQEDLLLQPGLAYGQRDEGLLRWLPRQSFAGLKLVVGQHMAFDLGDGEQTPGLVLRLEPERALIDFNHPLADQPLRLRLQVLEVSA